MAHKYKKYLKKSAKIAAWILGSLLGVFLLIVLLLQVPAVQQFVKGKAVTFLEEKIGTHVALERIEIALPKNVVLKGIYLEDQRGDTLLYGEKIKVDIALFELFRNKIDINSVALQGIVANVSRSKDSVFNFDYIINSFDSGEPKDTTATAMEVSLNRILIERTRIHFDDAISKNDLHVSIGHFKTKIDDFDLDNLDFDVPEIALHDVALKLKQGELVREIAEESVEIADSIASKPGFAIKLGTIDFQRITLDYDNVGARQNTMFQIGKLFADVASSDIENRRIGLNEFTLEQVRAQLVLTKYETPKPELTEESPAQTAKPWTFWADDVNLSGINLIFDDQNQVRKPHGIDFTNLNISDFALKAKKLRYENDEASGRIAELRFKEQSGVDLREFSTDFKYGKTSAYLKDLYLETPRTLLRESIVLEYSNVDDITNHPERVGIRASLPDTRIGFSDILLFAPDLRTTNPFASYPQAILRLDTQLQGRLNNLDIPELALSGIGQTQLQASARITGLPDMENAFFDVRIARLNTGAADLKRITPQGTIPASVSLPPSLSLTGSFKGKINNFATRLHLQSSYGSARVQAQLDQRAKNLETYDAQIQVNAFDLGRLLSNDSIGKVTMKMDVNGTGLDPKTANATLSGQINSAEYNGYVYRDLDLDGKIASGDFDLQANMQDPNLTFDLVASGRFEDKFPTAKLRLNAEMIDLNQLNLHAGPMKMRGKIDADFASTNPDALNGDLYAYHFVIANEKEQFQLDTLHFNAFSAADSTRLGIDSQFLKAEMTGDFQLTKLFSEISRTVSKYYATKPAAAIRPEELAAQRMYLQAQITNDPVLSKLMPQLKRLEPITLEAAYESTTDSLSVNANIPRLVYGNNTISGARLTAGTEKDSIAYAFNIEHVESPQFELHRTDLSGSIKDNVISYDLAIHDADDERQYALAGRVSQTDGATEIKLEPEGLRLNYEEWDLASGNLIRLENGGIIADQFELSHSGSTLALQSTPLAPNAPLKATFDNFSLETFTAVLQKPGKESLAIGGTLNGEAEFTNLQRSPAFTADATISDFSFSRDTIGNIALKVDNRIAGTYNANVVLSGYDNDVTIDGVYRDSDQGLQLTVAIDRLQMASIQPFTAGELTNSTGYLSGNLRVGGTIPDPDLTGTLQFHNVNITATQLNSAFLIADETLSFTPKGLSFDSFRLFDEESNTLVLDGDVLTTNYRDYAFDLNLSANNFRAVNSSARDNDLFYGKLYIDTRLDIGGDLNLPEISGSLAINDETDFTVVLPQSDPAIADREGIVEFVDRDNPQLTDPLMTEIDSLETSALRGMDVNVNITIEKEAALTLVVDEGNGDFLRLKGEAQLNGGIDPSGKTSLTGRYELSEGAYEMSFNMLRRRFEIQKGSYLLWTGSPTSADINITAVYTSNTPPIDLLGDQIASLSPSVRNMYKQRLPFQTHLIMTGELLQPEISFDIKLPDANYGVSSEIVETSREKLEELRRNPAELNKQVFALLLLNRFIGENPFASEAGGMTAETMARQSVSRLLSQQLNNIAGNLIQGVELDFDLESGEDFSTGTRQTRTDLNVGVSKRLLNDRLKVTVGSNFELEGNQRVNENATNIAGDLAIDYMLTRDGRYAIRAYRKNEYQVALQGQVIETGVAFIITMDYDKFRELFHRSPEERRMIREERRRERQKKERENAEQKAREDEEKNSDNDE